MKSPRSPRNSASERQRTMSACLVLRAGGWNRSFKRNHLMASDKKIRVAIVGLGFGAEFIPIYQRHPHAEIYAICRRTEKALNECGDRWGIKTRYIDYNKLLQDPNVDAVHINSPIPDHAPQTLAAIKAGKHVACTVPMATSVAECKQLLEAQRA